MRGAEEVSTLPAFLPSPDAAAKPKRRTPVEVAVDKAADFYEGLVRRELPQEWSLALTLAWVQSGGLTR